MPTPTATPTTTPTPAVTTGPVYWGGLTEAQLAAFQQRQGADRNDCADYSVAAVFNMIQGGAVQGSDVARAADLGNLLYGYRDVTTREKQTPCVRHMRTGVSGWAKDRVEAP